jgi:nucleotide-binding universal stress UspA family protein
VVRVNQVEGAIVVGVDGSAESLMAVRWAAAEAAERQCGLHLVHALDPIIGCYGAGLPVPQSIFDEMDAGGRRVLAEARDAVGSDLVVTTEMPRRLAIPRFVELSESARMIVLGASGRGGFVGMLTGSTAVSVAAHAQCAVVVVRGDLSGTGPVVVGVDGSANSELAVGAAFDEASWRKVSLVVVHAWTDADYIEVPLPQYSYVDWGAVDQQQERVLAESLVGWQDKYPDVEVQRALVRDRPAQELLRRSADAQLVVVGSRGRGGFAGLLLGSTSQALVHHSSCPVMILRQEEQTV